MRKNIHFLEKVPFLIVILYIFDLNLIQILQMSFGKIRELIGRVNPKVRLNLSESQTHFFYKAERWIK